MGVKPSISTSGASLTYYNIAIANSASKQAILSQNLQSNSFMSGRPFIFDLVFDVITPTLGILPTITIGIDLNGTPYTIVSGALASLSLTNRRFKVKGSLTPISDDSKNLLLDGEVRQYGGLAIAGTNTNTQFFNEYTNIDISSDITFAVTIQASAILGGVSVLLKKATIGMV